MYGHAEYTLEISHYSFLKLLDRKEFAYKNKTIELTIELIICARFNSKTINFANNY